MRKHLFILLLFILATECGCQKQNEDVGDAVPSSSISVSIDPAYTTVLPGQTIKLLESINDENALTDLIVTASVGGGANTQIENISLNGKTTFFDSMIYTVPAGFVGTILLNFKVDDNKGTQNTKVTIKVVPQVSVYNVTLSNYKDNTYGSFLNSYLGTVYNTPAALTNDSLVDIVFFNDSTDKATLASPDDITLNAGKGPLALLGVQNWPIKNSTTFRKTGLININNINTNDSVFKCYNLATPFAANTRANMLQPNEVIAFMSGLKPNQLGLIKILNIGSSPDGSGTVTLQVVVQN